MNTTSAVEKREKAVDYVSDEGIKVRVSYPDDETAEDQQDVRYFPRCNAPQRNKGRN